MKEILLRDLRDAVRSLARRPGFSLAVVLLLALGLGATTLAFGFLKGLLLEPFSLPALNRFFLVEADLPRLEVRRGMLAGPEYTVLFELAAPAPGAVFAGLGAELDFGLNLTGDEGEPQRLMGLMISSGLLAMAGAEPAVGRGFTPADDVPGGPAVVLLSHRLWRGRFAGDPNVVGRDVRLNDEPYTVLGITPPGWRFKDADVFFPLTRTLHKYYGAALADLPRSLRTLEVLAVPAPGISRRQAAQRLEALARQIEQQHGATHPQYENWRLGLRPLRESHLGEIKGAFLSSVAAAGLILLVVCGNVGHLLLVRALGRQREIALRLAFGASRRQLVRQLFAESLCLALLGGAAGALLAALLARPLQNLLPARHLPTDAALALDSEMFAFVAAVSLGATLLFGLVPAWLASGWSPLGALGAGGPRHTGSRSAHRVHRALVSVQIGLALVVMLGFAQVGRGFGELLRVDPGFTANPAEILTFQLTLPRARYPEADQVGRFFSFLVERIEALPGVSDSGAVLMLPLEKWTPSPRLAVLEGREGELERRVGYYPATPGYFAALGVAARPGRVFERVDTAESQPVAVINRAFAERIFPDQDPLGRRLRVEPVPGRGSDGEPQPWRTIVGVVDDVLQNEITRDVAPAVFVPLDQAFTLRVPWLRIAVRAGGVDPSSLSDAVRREVWALDAELPVYEVRTLADLVDEALAGPRLAAVLLGGFAILAVLLAGVALYGAIAGGVRRRQREIAVRLAVGANQRAIRRMILRESAALVAGGAALGLVGSVAVLRWLSSQGLAVRLADPWTIGVALSLLVLIVLAASWGPARRAARVQPAEQLRP